MKRTELVKVSKSQAEDIYNTGGQIIVWYTFINLDNKEVPKENRFRFMDYKMSFDAIQSIYKVSCVKNVEYYTDTQSLEANAMCSLMCN